MEYSNSWFDDGKHVWDLIIPQFKPKKILEIGSYEGRSICYLIETLGNESDLEIHAIDSWQGGTDHISLQLKTTVPMNKIEERFYLNTKESISKVSKKIELLVHKGFSHKELAALLFYDFEGTFDFIYVDGSHETSDTLSDCAMALHLLKKGGLMIVDDYLWHVDDKPFYRPKLAIDAFVNTNYYKLEVIQAPNAQIYLVKK